MPLLIIMAAVSVFVVLFALQNAQIVSLNFIFMEFQGSLALVTIITFCCGLLVAGCYAGILKAKHYMKAKKMQEQIDALTKEKAKAEELVAYLKEHNGQMPEPPKVKEVKNPFIRQW